MDSITHGFIGALVAQLGLRQRIGRDATWAAAIAAMLPDLDILVAPMLSLAGMGDSFSGLKIHRGITHSIVAMPFYSLIIAGIWWLIRKKVRNRGNNNNGLAWQGEITPSAAVGPKPPQKPTPFRLLYICILLPVLSHALPDFCTSYGVQLFNPLSAARYSCDSIPIIDIIFTSMLMLSLLACYVVRKIWPPARRATFIIAAAALVLGLGYIAAGRHMHNAALAKAVDVCEKRGLLQPSQIVRKDAYPAIGSIFLWRAVIETGEAWTVARIHHFGGNDAGIRIASAKKVENSWVERARQLADFQTFDWFTMGHSRALYSRAGNHHVVEFQDVRYGRTTESLASFWIYRVIFDDGGNLIESEFTHSPRQAGDTRSIRRIWDDMWNP